MAPCTRASPRRDDGTRTGSLRSSGQTGSRAARGPVRCCVHKRVQAAINQVVSPSNESHSRFVRKLHFFVPRLLLSGAKLLLSEGEAHSHSPPPSPCCIFADKVTESSCCIIEDRRFAIFVLQHRFLLADYNAEKCLPSGCRNLLDDSHVKVQMESILSETSRLENSNFLSMIKSSNKLQLNEAMIVQCMMQCMKRKVSIRNAFIDKNTL